MGVSVAGLPSLSGSSYVCCCYGPRGYLPVCRDSYGGVSRPHFFMNISDFLLGLLVGVAGMYLFDQNLYDQLHEKLEKQQQYYEEMCQ